MDARTLFLEKRVSLLSTLCVNPAEVDTDALHALLEIVLPLEEKYQELNAVGIILTNAIGEPNIYLRKISTSFNILEKYGRNLLNPQKPKYWRSVKFNNPVFKTTVDAMKGGRDILRLYGYTEEQPDGMSFCDEVEEPDTYKVASVTLEVTLLRLELNLLIAGTHPHPEIFQELLPESSFSKSTLAVDPFQTQDKSRQADQQIPSDQHNPQSAGSLGSCGLCGEQDTSIHCPTCQLSLCVECDGRFHKHPSRANHQRVKDAAPGPSSLSPRTLMGSPPVMSPLPLKTLPGPSTLYQAPGAPLPPSGSSYFPGGLAAPNRSPGTWKSLSTPAPAPTASITTSRPPWRCTCCTTMNEGRSVLCVGCDRPRGCKTAPAPEPEGKSLGRGSWCCQACTFENEGTAVLCVVCERPRLAGKPSLTVPEPPPQPLESSQLVTAPKEMYGWDCERCTFWNTMPSSVCEMCNRTRAHGDNNQAQQEEEELKIGNRPDHLDVVSGKQEFNRQQKLRDDGAKLIKMIRVAGSSRWTDSGESSATHMPRAEEIAGPSAVCQKAAEYQTPSDGRKSGMTSLPPPAERFMAGSSSDRIGRASSVDQYGGVVTAPLDIYRQAPTQRKIGVTQQSETVGPSWAEADDIVEDNQMDCDEDRQEDGKAAGDMQQDAVVEKQNELVRQRALERVPTLRPGSVPVPAAEDKSIWIVGHSFIKWAARQAAQRGHGENLGFDRPRFLVKWCGKEGMQWKELLSRLNSMLAGMRCPDVLVIHLGENDLVVETGLTLIRAMKKDLLEIKRQWAGCFVMWTVFIPRQNWKGAHRQRAIDRARRKINAEMVRFCRNEGIGRIEHRDLRYENKEFFRGDGEHLSRYGTDLYLLELREVLARTLNIRQ
ncbi:E3 ubiquitin-protein ligase RNF31 isoform X3 [Lissotriton helveticus]